jgi:hypothetical protein
LDFRALRAVGDDVAAEAVLDGVFAAHFGFGSS